MKTVQLILLSAFLLNGHLMAQINSCPKCDSLKIKQVLDTLNYQNSYEFLCSFGNECKKESYFSFIGNNALFIILLENPLLVIKVIKDNSEIEKKIILKEIANPLGAPDIEGTFKKISELNIVSEIKEDILISLKKAANNNGLILK